MIVYLASLIIGSLLSLYFHKDEYHYSAVGASGAVTRSGRWHAAEAKRSAMRGRNILAGYLMRSTVALGLIGYRQLLLRKQG